MNFKKRKLLKSEVHLLRAVSRASIKPYRFLFTPLYVFLRKNEKYLAIKGPLDFFDPIELEQFAYVDSFYVHTFIDRLYPFESAGRIISKILNWKPRIEFAADFQVALKPAPYEISNAVLGYLGSLWGSQMQMEPFFTVPLIESIELSLDSDTLEDSRNLDVGLFEDALIFSAWIVFLGLMLGQCDYHYLHDLRKESFQYIIEGSTEDTSNFDDLYQLALWSFHISKERAVRFSDFENNPTLISKKLFWRLKRVDFEFKIEGAEELSLFGEKGILDAV